MSQRRAGLWVVAAAVAACRAPVETTPEPTVLAGDATVTDADALAALAGIREVEGDLVIAATDLAAVDLPALTRVGGSVRVWENPALVALSLPALTEIGGDLSLYDDPALSDLGGLGALGAIGGALSVNRMPAVASLQGLERLESVGTEVYLFHDDALATLDGLAGLRTVGADVKLWEDPALADATLPVLESIGGTLDLFYDDALAAVALPALTALGGYALQQCGSLPDVGEFPALTAVDHAVALRWQAGPTTLDGFAGLTRVGSLTLDHAGVGSLAALSALVDVNTELRLDANPGLTAVDLPALTSVGKLTVVNHGALADPGLAALATVAHAAQFTDNPELSQCAIEALFARVDAETYLCAGNRDDGCSAWCTP